MGKIMYTIPPIFWQIFVFCKRGFLQGFLFILTFFWAILPKQKKQGTYEADVYLLMSHSHCIRSVYAIASVQYFFPGIHVWIISDGTLTPFDRWLLCLFQFPLHIFSKSEVTALNVKAKKYTHLIHLAEFGWSGKKILYPLVHTKRKKIMLLDTDILFFRIPDEIMLWMRSSKQYNLYLKDYANFSIASTCELSKLLPGTEILTHVNTGLLCLNMVALQRAHPLKLMNGMIPKMITLVKSRMTYDYGPNVSDFVYTPPLIEQTLYAMLLSIVSSRSLPEKKYVVFPAHKFGGKPIHFPVFIHFTGEIGRINLPLYQYIFSSFIQSFLAFAYNISDQRAPWFLRSNVYCFIRSHHHELNVPRDRIIP